MTAPTLRPPLVRPGDRVALVSPAGPPSAARVDRGIALLTSWGLRPEVAPHAQDRYAYLAGTDADRAADLNAALRDPGIRAVLATRGGYGSQRIVDALDIDAIRRAPKVVAGFSDITGLQLALWRAARLACVHGPGAAWNDARTPEASAESLRRALMTTDPVVVARDDTAPTAALSQGGGATGVLLGGNLSLLASAAGTPDFPDLTGAILLLEEVGEAPYRVDRLLTQLRRTGALGGLAGVALGQFTDCVDGWPRTVEEVIADRLGDLGVPVLGGLPIGHGPGHLSVPLGVPATLDAAGGQLTVDPAVVCQSDADDGHPFGGIGN